MSYYDDDDDFGPPDSDYGDSEADHVWADLARSEYEGEIPEEEHCPESPDGFHEYASEQAERCQHCGH